MAILASQRHTERMRRGTANLPLHGGRVPAWLGKRMTALGTVITQAIVLEYGRDEFLRRLSHPFWFQSFGAVMGMDWHSSGITTSVMGALKRGLSPLQKELGIYVCGGRGKHSRKTPEELLAVGQTTGLDGDSFAQTSRLVAKIDSAAVQDGFQLYLHSFIVTDDGSWCVVQQGMNGAKREARRYHWLSEDISSFVEDPHAAIDGPNKGNIINLADYRAAKSRRSQLRLLAEGPDAVLESVAQAKRLRESASSHQPHLRMPGHHEVRPEDVIAKRLHATLAAAAERAPRDYEELLLTPGVGARTVESLALVAEVIHGSASRFSDPARFSLAHGGKDGHPFPVPLKVYDKSIAVLRSAVERARLDNADRMAALKALHQAALRLEGTVQGPSVSEYMASERAKSKRFGGRTVYGEKTSAVASPHRSTSRERAAQESTAQQRAAQNNAKESAAVPTKARVPKVKKSAASRQLTLFG